MICLEADEMVLLECAYHIVPSIVQVHLVIYIVVAQLLDGTADTNNT